MRTRSWIKHIPGVASLQRLVVRTLLAGEPFLHTINAGPAKGLRLQVRLPEDKALWSGTFEPAFAASLAAAVRAGDVCYDIGGYRGYLSGVLALAGASRVVIFEPLPANIAALRSLIELNCELPLQLEETAVGCVDGDIEFKIMPDGSMGKLASSHFQREQPCVSRITVQV